MTQTDTQDLLDTTREHFREGNYRIAESLLQQILVSGAKNPEVYHMLATIYYDQGKFNKAIKTFRRALELDPGYTDASVGLSIILNDLGKYEEGKQVFEDAQEYLARKSADGDPYIQERLATKHDELGELYLQYKRYDEALEQWQKALTLSTRTPELKMKIIETYLKVGEEDMALRELKYLVQEHPQFVPARLKLGLLYYQGKKTIEAVEQWEDVLLRDPEHPQALKYLHMVQETDTTLL